MIATFFASIAAARGAASCFRLCNAEQLALPLVVIMVVIMVVVVVG